MKLKDIIKEIAKNKDQFSKLNESKSNPKLEALVKDIINEFSKQINLKISFKVTKRREGDVDISYADSTSAKKNLGWKNKYNLVDMCKHTINSFKNYE